MYGQSPAIAYLGICPYEHWMIQAIDLACSCAVWEDENNKYSESSKKAGNEAALLGDALEELKRQQDER